MNEIQNNIENIKNEINNLNKKTELVAVSKFFPVEDIKLAIESGQLIFGESKAQELRDKYEILKNEKIKWHFIGRIQTNKIKYIVPICELIHSVSRIKEIKEIDKRAKENDKIQKILIEVNTSGEESKSGINPDMVNDFIEKTKNFNNIEICGLMTMAPFTNDENIIRNSFHSLRKIKEELSKKYKNIKELSMGMSNDYKVAIEEGSTLIRVGSKIFGKRNY